MIKFLIRKIRRKSKETRNNVAFVLALMVTAVVFAGWAYSDPANLSFDGGSQMAEASPVFSQFFSGVGDRVSDLGKANEELDALENGQSLDSESISKPASRSASLERDLYADLYEKADERSGSSTEVEAAVLDVIATTSQSYPVEPEYSEPRPIRIVTTPLKTASTSTP